MKNLHGFYKPQFNWISLNISLSDERLQANVLNLTCQCISVSELLQIVNFDGLTFLTASVLFNQSDYLNHSNKDSDWRIESIEHAGDTVVHFGNKVCLEN